MKKIWVFIIVGIVLLIALLGGVMFTRSSKTTPEPHDLIGGKIVLPQPARDSQTSLEEALQARRSIREYRDEPLSLVEASQLMWAAQGITDPGGYRTAPSAGALYPLEIYLVVGKVEGLQAGVYKYLPEGHEIIKVADGDIRQALRKAALNQEAVKDAAAVILITAIYERTTIKYGERGIRYVHMEVGCAAQNIYLQAVSLNLGTVFIGAFHDEELKKIIPMQKDEQPLALIPVGRK